MSGFIHPVLKLSWLLPKRTLVTPIDRTPRCSVPSHLAIPVETVSADTTPADTTVKTVNGNTVSPSVAVMIGFDQKSRVLIDEESTEVTSPFASVEHGKSEG
jgi:hypothetical protein